jgi:hypothetical protein
MRADALDIANCARIERARANTRRSKLTDGTVAGGFVPGD